MTAGLSTRAVIDREEQSMKRAIVGGYLKTGSSSSNKAPAADRRSSRHGLMLGVEPMRDHANPKRPRHIEAIRTVLEQCKRARRLMRAKGGLCGTCSTHTSAVCLTTDDAGFLGDCLTRR